MSKLSSAAESRLVGCLFPPVLIGVGLAALWLFYLWPSQRIAAAKHWEKVPCRISKNQLLGGDHPAKLKVVFQYEFGDREYSGKNYDIYGLLGLHSGEDDWAREVHLRLAVGQQTVCYVNPEAPEEAVLNRAPRTGWFGWFYGVLFISIGLGILVFRGSFTLCVKHRMLPPPAHRTHPRTTRLSLEEEGWS